MHERPYTLLSCSVSMDGYIASAASRLLLSNEADFDRVDAVRASCDAILVGATTVRNDNPRLLVRLQALREGTDRARARADADEGHRDPPGGARRALSSSPPGRGGEARLLRAAACRRRPRATRTGRDRRRRRTTVEMCTLTDDLAERGVERLMVEGGATVHTQFLTADLVDELQLVVAPVFVGDSQAPRFVRDGRFPGTRPGARSSPTSARSATSCCSAASSSRFEDD